MDVHVSPTQAIEKGYERNKSLGPPCIDENEDETVRVAYSAFPQEHTSDRTYRGHNSGLGRKTIASGKWDRSSKSIECVCGKSFGAEKTKRRFMIMGGDPTHIST